MSSRSQSSNAYKDKTYMRNTNKVKAVNYLVVVGGATWRATRDGRVVVITLRRTMVQQGKYYILGNAINITLRVQII